ncbi:VOC family protein [Kitasatospora sp. NPDC096147]|uniref:VOC family protein n=1 Tax=Kitasatospora sp. NPDC096147 TaxID=3364093 RepID=UPI0037F2761E
MKITEVRPGRPCWFEHSSADPGAAQRYYGELFGWEGETDPRPEAMCYTVMRLEGAVVASVVQLVAEGQPTAWSVSVAVEDVDAAAEAAQASGGQLLAGPMEALDLGRFAVVADPAGAVFGLWRGRAFPGAERFAEPGAAGWIELATRDVAGAVGFYHGLFGWSVSSGEQYTQWGLDGTDFGGVLDMGEQFPADLPPYWMPYFEAADVDLTAERAVILGGEAVLPPTDAPDGPRLAVLKDPLGAVFGLYQALG